MKKGSGMKQVHGRQVVVTALLAGLLGVGPRLVAADADGNGTIGSGGRSGTEQTRLLDADGGGMYGSGH
jgi:hypothetical protein